MKIKVSKNEKWNASASAGLLALIFGFLGIPIVICILFLLLIIAIPLSMLVGTFFFLTGLIGYTKIEYEKKDNTIKDNELVNVNKE